MTAGNVLLSSGLTGRLPEAVPKAVKQRQERLLALLDEQGELDVPAMVRALGASEATVRRDLASLEAAGLLVRALGGARSLGASSLVARTFAEKRGRMRKEKEQIARAAAGLVEPGMTVALDSGTTAWRVAVALREREPLTIVTSAMAPVEELGPLRSMSVLLAGGTFRLENLDFVGPAAIRQLKALRADIAFVGADSLVPGKGGFSLDEASAAVAGALARCADRKVVVLDHSKFDARGRHLVIPAAEIHCLITDPGLDEQTRSRLQSEDYELVIAS